jgi:hypothetical protein
MHSIISMRVHSAINLTRMYIQRIAIIMENGKENNNCRVCVCVCELLCMRAVNILTIKFNLTISVAEGVFRDTAITAEVILGHRMNCQLHGYFVERSLLAWLEALT